MYGYGPRPSASTHYHQCPTCRGNVRYGQRCCSNPVADMLVVEGILNDNMGEVVAGEMLGGGGFGDALVMAAEVEIIEDLFGDF